MRFLADGGISPRTVEFLKQLGHDAVHVRTLGLHRAADSDLMERARADVRVVLTFDLDFGEDHLFSADRFVAIEVPAGVRASLLRAARG